jgi:hypothetical protein
MSRALVPVADLYQAIVPSLKTDFPEFVLSPEYEMVDKCDDLPGVILAAFACYLIKLTTSGIVCFELSRGIAVIEALYELNHTDIKVSICDEFIEAFDGAPAAVELVRPLLCKPLAEAFVRVLG